MIMKSQIREQSFFSDEAGGERHGRAQAAEDFVFSTNSKRNGGRGDVHNALGNVLTQPYVRAYHKVP